MAGEVKTRTRGIEMGLTLAGLVPAPIYLLLCYSTIGLVDRWQRVSLASKLATFALVSLFATTVIASLASVFAGPLPRPKRLLWGLAVIFLYGLTPAALALGGKLVLGEGFYSRW